MMGFFDRFKNSSKPKKFKYLDKLIHSGVKEIILDSDIVLGGREEKKYLEGIKLDVDDLIIDGNGHAIDAQGLTRIFHCTGKNIIIKNIILKKGFTEENGGAIHNGGELTIASSTLTENTAKRGGGAINNELECELTIIESTLNNNTAKCGGGAIHNWGELTIASSTLTENTAKWGGGAIDASGGKLTITETTLTRNTAKEGGGAIHNWSELTITESAFNNNTAQDRGGAINNFEGKLTITETTLTLNTAKEGCGAIFNRKGNFKIFNCEFSNNKSLNNIILNNDSLQIHNAVFKDNQSKYIVLNDGDGANLGIFNGEFNENNVEKSVLCNSGKFCSVERTVFENNISDNKINIINESKLTLTSPKIKDKEKSILNQNYILIRKSPPELENIICGEGTVDVDEKIIPQGKSFDFGYLDKKIHESNTKEIILDHDITFENYEIDFYEGGIELDIDYLIINGNGHIIDGADKSRIFIITGKNITLKNIVFKNGHAHKNYDNPLNNNGGAIKINRNSNITIENCEFINNISEEYGGAIGNAGELTINESTLNNNTSGSGGAINNWSELTITSSTLSGNTSEEYGGAIDNFGGKLTITESIFNNNTANWGGAINNFESKLTITESTLTGNTARKRGGAINNWSELTIASSTLSGNTSEEYGGAIRNFVGKLTITESTLNNNTSGSGGAIYNKKGELTITESTLTENTAQKYGGAICLKESKKYESENCTFKDNKPDDVYEEK